MSAIAQQESHVKESLFHFITKNVPSADLNVIDEIVLSYVISILEEASQDPCFDVEGFIEMMGAYVPEFANIDAGAVLTWLLELEAELTRPGIAFENQDDSARCDKMSITLHNLCDILPTVTKTSRSHSNSETSEGSEHIVLEEQDEWAEQCAVLQEMFPHTSVMEIKHCISIAGGEISSAASTLLHRRDNGESLCSSSFVPRPARVDDSVLKSRIIARYSYVDKDAETKEHKPLAPKIEPKKMVRYRDNKIVSLRGERYTEVAKSGVEEENLKKPKKQHCP